MHSIKRDASHPGSARGRDALPVDAVSTIEQLREVRLARRRAEAREFELAAHFADLHSKPSTGRALPGCEQSLPLGCDGTPPVAEFAALELSTALGIRPVEASALMAAALDVRHRLPWVWRSTMAAEVPVWQARNLADLVRELDWDAAHLVDLELSQTLPGMPWCRAEAMVRGLVLGHLHVDRAEQRRREALQDRGVWIAQEDDGVAGLSARIDAPQAADLEASIDLLARILGEGGATRGPRCPAGLCPGSARDSGPCPAADAGQPRATCAAPSRWIRSGCCPAPSSWCTSPTPLLPAAPALLVR